MAWGAWTWLTCGAQTGGNGPRTWAVFAGIVGPGPTDAEVRVTPDCLNSGREAVVEILGILYVFGRVPVGTETKIKFSYE